MAASGPQLIGAVIEHLQRQDIEMMLSNRGLPAVGSKEELTVRLQHALTEEICEWEWERAEPGFHADLIGAGASMVTHGNSIYVFGGMNEERAEHMAMWRWDLGCDDGFVEVAYRGPMPPKLVAGHYAAVYGDELWVFPGPRNHNMRRVYCCDLIRHRWAERSTIGDPPSDAHARRSLECFVDGGRLLVFGGPQMDRLGVFDFESRTWSTLMLKGSLPTWTFGHATKRGSYLWAFGCVARIGEEAAIEMWRLDLLTLRWKKIETTGNVPPYRIHCSAAVIGEKWILHGGRKPGKFNVRHETYTFDFSTNRWSALMAEGLTPVAREWHKALGLQGCMVVVAGRIDIPEYEPIPLSSDIMSNSVEILWYKPPPKKMEPSGRAVLLNSLRELYNTDHMSDMTLVVGGRRIPAHRHVLATHSIVFDRMLSTSMREMVTNEVKIEDFDADTVLLLLQYMYGCLEDLPSDHSQIVELFKASDKYHVDGLVKECIEIFRKITRAEDVASLLEVSHERDSQELRDVCMEVTCQCLPNVVATPAFKHLAQQQPELGLNFVAEVAIKMGMPHFEPAASSLSDQDDLANLGSPDMNKEGYSEATSGIDSQKDADELLLSPRRMAAF